MSFLPSDLQIALNQAESAMILHPQHDLNLGYRQLIWSKLGSRKDFFAKNRWIGLRRRVQLAIFSTQRVLSIWNKIYPDDDLPYRALDSAKKVLNKTLDEDVAWEQRNIFWNQLVEMGNRDKEKQVFQGVGFSAVQALTAALRDEIFDPSKINLELVDADINPNEMDSSFFAAAAYAFGAIWDSDSNPYKRKEFWEWWLKEAIPSTWETVS